MDKKHSSSKLSELYELVRAELLKRKEERGALFIDTLAFLVAFFFSRTHIAFGAYPLGIALVAVTDRRAVIAALGAFVGALTVGSTGLVYALVMPLVLLLRLILSSDEEGSLFSESYVVRVMSAAVASSLVGIYELAVGGFSLPSVLFASSGVLLAVGISISLFGVFSYKSSIKELLLAKGRTEHKLGNEGRVGAWLFRGSALVLIFLIGVSLGEYVFFGINLSYVFSAAVTIFAAARFGSSYAIAVGFMSGLSTSAIGGAAYALAGAAVGFLYPVGYAYALVGGAVVLSVFSGYAEGVLGFLSLFPEYGVSAILMLPYLKGERRIRTDDGTEQISVGESVHALIEDATRHLSGGKRSVDDAISELSRVKFPSLAECDFSEYRNIIIAITAGQDPTPCDENIDALAAKMYKKARSTEDDVCRLLGEEAGSYYSELTRRVGEYERECYNGRTKRSSGYEYGHLARMLRRERSRRLSESTPDLSLSEKIRDEILSLGACEPEVRVLGEREKRIFIAARNGEELLSSPKLKKSIEAVLGAPICDIEYFKRSDVSLLSAKQSPPLRAEVSTVGSASSRTGVSGDSHLNLVRDGVLFSVISDGEGSGERAALLSRFVTEYLGCTLSADSSSAAESLGAIDAIFKEQREECFATADVFSLDLFRSEARLVKAGAASSFVIRDGSVLSVRAKGAPLGCGGGAEETVIPLCAGSTVVMMSDGIAPLADESAWLIEEVAKENALSARDRAERILSLARTNTGDADDMTVTVIKVYSNE